MTAVTGAAVVAAGDAVTAPSRTSVYGRYLWRAFSPLLVSVVLAVVVWEIFAKLVDNPLLAKTPGQVFGFVFTDPDAAKNRGVIKSLMGVTLRDAGYGFLGGMAAAIVVASAFVLFRSVEQALMPIAMLLRSVPLVAMTPIIVLIAGRGVKGVAIIAGIVVFFPALVTIVFGLRSVGAQTRDLVVAYGGTDATVLRKVAFPTALPAMFAAARISVPGALIGSLVAEWLATGQGIGGQIARDPVQFKYTEIWALIAVLTAVSIVLYTLVGLFETFVLARYGPAPSRS